jgi:hypothetical protein
VLTHFKGVCAFLEANVQHASRQKEETNDVVRQTGNMRETGVATNLRNIVLLGKWEMWSVFQLGLGINGK